MMSSTLSKIHVTNSTGLSLNERFTAISTQPKVVTNIGNGRRSRSRSRSVQRKIPLPASSEHFTSRANQRLLAQLQRKHKMQAALKLKRRSMRTAGGGASYGNGSNARIRRGSVKAFRVGANGKPIRTNSLARVATMKADNESLNNRGGGGGPLRRSNSSGNLAGRLGPRRPSVGGAAERVAKRNLDRQRRRNSSGNLISGRGRSVINNRARSRSRSRTRTQSGSSRNRSRTRNIGNNQLTNRSRSRNRYRNDVVNAPSASNARRARSRSRSRGRNGGIVNKSNLPIKARLGVRPGVAAAATTTTTTASYRAPPKMRRNASLTRRGVQRGRVQKRRNFKNANAAASDNNGRGRIRSRSATRNARIGNVRSRSRSRTRKGQVSQQTQQRQQGPRNGRAPRGRSLQRRRGSSSNNGQRGGTNNNGKAQTQQRRGRSRTGRGSNGAGSRNKGNKTNPATKTAVNKDDLDKELDQYMATTKTENEMDFLLKN